MAEPESNNVGDRLYPMILDVYADVPTAGKLTGMLIDAMPADALESAMSDTAALKAILSEAHQALEAAGAATHESTKGVSPPVAGAANDPANGGRDVSTNETGRDFGASSNELTAVGTSNAKPLGPKDLLNKIKWHPGIAFANLFVDFRKRKSSGRLSKKVTGSPFITFSFSFLDKIEDDQVEQVLWKDSPIFKKGDEADQGMKRLDVDALGLTNPVEVEQAEMINGILEGHRASRPAAVEKVASGAAKFEPTPHRRKAEVDLEEHLSRAGVDPANISLAAAALQPYYTEDQLQRSAQSIANWSDKIERYCWSGACTSFVLDDTPGAVVALFKSAEFGPCGFGLKLLGRNYVCIWITHRFNFHQRVNYWRLGFHHQETGSRVVCILITPGTPLVTGSKEQPSATDSSSLICSTTNGEVNPDAEDADGGNDRLSNLRSGDQWAAELWATTNFPHASKQSRQLINACKHLPNNYVRHVGMPE